MVKNQKVLADLYALGADKVEHLNGDLAVHLQGTFDVLVRWDNPEPVCLAGLYHAIYGTDGLDIGLVGPDQRDSVARMIGRQAEELVYLYGAADRRYFYQQLTASDQPMHRDRFTGQESPVSAEDLKGFCELTLANEIEINTQDPGHLQRYAPVFARLFDHHRFRRNLSEKALGEYLAL